MMKFLSRTLLLSLLAFFALRPAHAQVMVGVHVSFGPPALPIYDQPPCPEDGYMWTPGYWAYDDDDGYYWVPGTWLAAPEPGYLWTPGWWGWDDGGFFLWHEGYWGEHVGFYGGIDYGFGYTGDGFYGGRWDHDHFFYNTAVVHVNEENIHNVYRDTTVIHNTTVNESHVSFNGGQGGIEARPTREQQSYSQEHHVAPVAAQTQHMQMARSNPQLRASVNQGRPQIAATARANQFSGNGAVAARQAGGEYHAPAQQPRGGEPGRNNEVRPAAPGGNEAQPTNEARPAAENPSHARDLQPHQVQQSPNEGNSKEQQRYQQQQQKLIDKQNQEHQKLAQQQEKEDQKAQKQNLNQQRQQQMEQKHQQQTQQMEQRHQQQSQHVQERQAPAQHPSAQPRERPH